MKKQQTKSDFQLWYEAKFNQPMPIYLPQPGEKETAGTICK